jgi:hypothetical protein
MLQKWEQRGRKKIHLSVVLITFIAVVCTRFAVFTLADYYICQQYRQQIKFKYKNLSKILNNEFEK